MAGSSEEQGPPKAALAALVIVALIVLGSLWVVNRMHSVSAIQDCVASGRTNCAPITTGK